MPAITALSSVPLMVTVTCWELPSMEWTRTFSVIDSPSFSPWIVGCELSAVYVQWPKLLIESVPNCPWSDSAENCAWPSSLSVTVSAPSIRSCPAWTPLSSVSDAVEVPAIIALSSVPFMVTDTCCDVPSTEWTSTVSVTDSPVFKPWILAWELSAV